MEVTYERDVSHCDSESGVKEGTIVSVVAADNSDNLEVIKLDNLAYQVVSQKGLHQVGKKVIYFPPEAILPKEFSDEIGVTGYLSKGVIKAVRLRGNRSEGLIVDVDKATPYLDYIKRWETPYTAKFSGSMMSPKHYPSIFAIFYKMPNLKNEPDTINDGEEVYFAEKIHGTNCRFGVLPTPEKDDAKLYVGTHKTVRKQEYEDDLYWSTIKSTIMKSQGIIIPGYVYYGEIYGKGIQDLWYGEPTPTMRVFSIMDSNGEYLLPRQVMELCDTNNIPRVPFHRTTYQGIEWAIAQSEKESEYWDGLREGVVIYSATRPRVMAKVINFNYLTRKKGTERH